MAERIMASVDGAPREGNLDYRFPNVMELFIDPPGKIFRLMVSCIPEDHNHDAALAPNGPKFCAFVGLYPVFRWMNRRIANEDRAIVESSLPAEVPPPGEERSIRTDAPTLAFRKIYRERLLGSNATPPMRVAASL